MIDDEVVLYYKITSKFEGKSAYIQSKYYEIKDWIAAGLRQPSWVDTINPRLLSTEELSVHVIGRFTKRDIEGLVAFLEERLKDS